MLLMTGSRVMTASPLYFIAAPPSLATQHCRRDQRPHHHHHHCDETHNLAALDPYPCRGRRRKMLICRLWLLAEFSCLNP
jgi:hypothetical protein